VRLQISVPFFKLKKEDNIENNALLNAISHRECFKRKCLKLATLLISRGQRISRD
jgi:hypothetical protein